MRLERLTRVHSLAWPILAANTQFCGSRTVHATGLMVTDADGLSELVEGLSPRRLKKLGFDDRPRIALIAAGSPADAAGAPLGAALIQIDDKKLAADARADAARKLIHKSLRDDDHAVALRLETAAGDTVDLEIDGAEICRAPLFLTTSTTINAYTNGRKIVLHSGLEQALDDDATLSLVIAHELAHMALKHPRKATRNAVVTGSILWGPALATAGTAADIALSVIGQETPVPLGRAGAAMAVYPYSAEFEREVDYLGLYMMARAGLSLEGAEEAFEIFANERPVSTWLQLTHPTTPERVLAIRAARAEIEAKLRDGAELTPDRQ